MNHVYGFEELDDSLDLLPLAARRALDLAGLKVSLAAWRASSNPFRRVLVALGAGDVVDAGRVLAAIVEAGVEHAPVATVADPAPDALPDTLGPRVSEGQWRALRAVDRYALAKVARGKHPDAVLPRALAEIVPLSTHVDASSGEARMVDVGAKAVTARVAVARAHVTMGAPTIARLRAGDVAKGDVLGVARIAGIQAAKRTPELIPLCHAIALTRVTVDLTIDASGVEIEARCEATDRTGVEMEALTAASVAALTVYDMLKGSDRSMRIQVELSEKHGGKTGSWTRARQDRRTSGEEE